MNDRSRPARGFPSEKSRLAPVGPQAGRPDATILAADRRTHEELHPTIREDRSGLARAERQAHRRGGAPDALPDALHGDAPPAMGPRPASAGGFMRATAASAHRGGLAVERVEPPAGELEATSDVSFPLELQRGEALADPLRKLNPLRVQGILTEEEFAIAKARLLG